MKHIASSSGNVLFLFACTFAICESALLCLVLLLVLLEVNVCFFSSSDSILQLQVHAYLIQLCGVGFHNTKVDADILIYIWSS